MIVLNSLNLLLIMGILLVIDLPSLTPDHFYIVRLSVI
jgi:hypothetical protein